MGDFIASGKETNGSSKLCNIKVSIFRKASGRKDNQVVTCNTKVNISHKASNVEENQMVIKKEGS